MANDRAELLRQLKKKLKHRDDQSFFLVFHFFLHVTLILPYLFTHTWDTDHISKTMHAGGFVGAIRLTPGLSIGEVIINFQDADILLLDPDRAMFGRCYFISRQRRQS